MLPQISSLALEVLIASTGFISSLIASGVIFRAYVAFKRHLAKVSDILKAAGISLSALAVNASAVSIISMTAAGKSDSEFVQFLQKLKELSQSGTFALSATVAALSALCVTIYFSVASYRKQIQSIDKMESRIDDLMRLIASYDVEKAVDIQGFEREDSKFTTAPAKRDDRED